MLKKAGVAAAVVAAGFLIATPFAYADDNGNDSHIQIGGSNSQDNIVQLPIQACNNSGGEGVAGGKVAHQKNEDSHDGKCAQKTEAENNSGN